MKTASLIFKNKKLKTIYICVCGEREGGVLVSLEIERIIKVEAWLDKFNLFIFSCDITYL